MTQDGPSKPTWGLRDDHQSSDGYNTRRLRANYTHQFNEDWVGYGHVRRDWGKDEFEIWDAYATYGGWDFANITVGQMTAPFSRDYLISDTKCPVAERPLIGTILSPKRDIGLLLHNARCTERFGWYAGVFGGEGANEPDFRGTFMPVVRAELAVTDQLNVGLNWYSNDSPTTTPYHKFLKKNNPTRRPVVTTVEGRWMVITGAYDNNLYGLDAKTGKELWRFTAGGPLGAAPTFAMVGDRPTVFIAGSDRTLYAI